MHDDLGCMSSDLLPSCLSGWSDIRDPHSKHSVRFRTRRLCLGGPQDETHKNDVVRGADPATWAAGSQSQHANRAGVPPLRQRFNVTSSFPSSPEQPMDACAQDQSKVWPLLQQNSAIRQTPAATLTIVAASQPLLKPCQIKACHSLYTSLSTPPCSTSDSRSPRRPCTLPVCPSAASAA